MPRWGLRSHSVTSRSGSGYGSGLSNTPLMMLKIAVFAPMPSASVSTATAVKPGFFNSWRKANLRSFITKRHHRINSCGTAGRDKTCRSCYGNEEERDNGERHRIGRRHAEQQARQGLGDPEGA